MKRFDNNATTVGDALRYILNRSEQLLLDGYKLVGVRPVYFDKFDGAAGILASFTKNKDFYISLYLLKQARGRNFYVDYLREFPSCVVTTPGCEMQTFLKEHSIPHKVAHKFSLNPHYQWIQKVYGNTQAKRSGEFCMNHIDEGLALLQKIGCKRQHAKEAFCLHPIMQSDEWFKTHCLELKENKKIDPYSVLLSTEYRNVANAYLSPMGKRKAKDIQLSPILDVNQMLVADKIQNRKDFEKHRKKFVNAEILDYYFKAWLERLEVSEQDYKELSKYITVKPGIPDE